MSSKTIRLKFKLSTPLLTAQKDTAFLHKRPMEFQWFLLLNSGQRSASFPQISFQSPPAEPILVRSVLLRKHYMPRKNTHTQVGSQAGKSKQKWQDPTCLQALKLQVPPTSKVVPEVTENPKKCFVSAREHPAWAHIFRNFRCICLCLQIEEIKNLSPRKQLLAKGKINKFLLERGHFPLGLPAIKDIFSLV